MKPKVGIILLTFATPKWREELPRVLASIQELDYPKDSLELICVESKSPSGEQVKSWFESEWMPKVGTSLPHVTYLQTNEVVGFAGNNNHGYEKAVELGCDYIFLLNADAEAHPHAITAAVERAEADPSIAYVQSFLLLGDKTHVNSIGNAYQFLGFGYSNGYEWTREQAEVFFQKERVRNPKLAIGYASGAGMLGRVSAIKACGLFDEKFFLYHEDTDASLAARAHGYDVVVEPASIVYHHYEAEKTQVKKNYLIERNRWVLLLSYYSWWTLLLILPMAFVMEVALCLFAWRGGWWEEKKRAYLDFKNPELRAWIKERRKHIQSTRTKGDRALLRFAVGAIEFQGDSVKNPVLTYIGNPLMRAYWWVVKKVTF